MSDLDKDKIDDRLYEILFPQNSERLNHLQSTKKHFVHYTTANAATSIIKNKSIWFRQPYLMNDRAELALGLGFLQKAYSDDNYRFKTLLESYYPGISTQIESDFDSLHRASTEDMYIFCVSEHEEHENDCGRLSMWRGYGRDAGVAIVLNHENFLTESPGINAYLSPVFYSNYQNFLDNFKKIQKNLIENEDFIKNIGPEVFQIGVLNMFRFSVLSTKHSGFSEEKEWRIIYSPLVEESPHLQRSVEVINGMPQEIHSFHLENDQAKGLMKVELNNLIEKIIIGPTNYPMPLYKAFVKLLSDAGVEDAARKVVVSDIPLRV